MAEGILTQVVLSAKRERDELIKLQHLKRRRVELDYVPDQQSHPLKTVLAQDTPLGEGAAVNLLVVVDTIHPVQHEVPLKRGGTATKCDVVVCDDTVEGRFLRLAFWGRAMCRWVTDAGAPGHLCAGDVVWISRVKLKLFMGAVCGSVGGQCSIVRLLDGRVPRGAGVADSDARVAELVAWRDARRRARDGVLGVGGCAAAASCDPAQAAAALAGPPAGAAPPPTRTACGVASAGSDSGPVSSSSHVLYTRIAELERRCAGTRVHLIARIEHIVLPDAPGTFGSALLSDGSSARVQLRLPLGSSLQLQGCREMSKKRRKRKLRKMVTRQRSAYETLQNTYEGEIVEVANVDVEHMPALHLRLVKGLTKIQGAGAGAALYRERVLASERSSSVAVSSVTDMLRAAATLDAATVRFALRLGPGPGSGYIAAVRVMREGVDAQGAPACTAPVSALTFSHGSKPTFSAAALRNFVELRCLCGSLVSTDAHGVHDCTSNCCAVPKNRAVRWMYKPLCLDLVAGRDAAPVPAFVPANVAPLFWGSLEARALANYVDHCAGVRKPLLLPDLLVVRCTCERDAFGVHRRNAYQFEVERAMRTRTTTTGSFTGQPAVPGTRVLGGGGGVD